VESASPAPVAVQFGVINQASEDCGAQVSSCDVEHQHSWFKVIESNKEAKHVGNILDTDKDSYMLNPCDVPSKYVVVELCDDILIDTIHFANLEIFSSTISEVRVSIADRCVCVRVWSW
jgi:hypothetical protein